MKVNLANPFHVLCKPTQFLNYVWPKIPSCNKSYVLDATYTSMPRRYCGFCSKSPQ